MDPEVYCVSARDPEVHAYAMAKYSRSALTMRQALEELSQTRAEQFLNTFYFQFEDVFCALRDLSAVRELVDQVGRCQCFQCVSRGDADARGGRARGSQAHHKPTEPHTRPEVISED